MKINLVKICFCFLFFLCLLAIFADWILPFKANQQALNEIYLAPSSSHLLGTDKLGRDILSRIIHAERISFGIGFIGILFSLPLATVYGAISGYFGSWIDSLMMRLAEAMMSIPNLYLLIILSSLLPANISNYHKFILITIIIALISWAGLARIIRGQILTLKNESFIEASKMLGEKNSKIIYKHLIPQISSFLLMAISTTIPSYIISESTLSFLGLGINEPDPSLGNILAQGKELSNIISHPWILWSPAITIFLTVFCFNTIADWLRDKAALR